MLTICSRRLCPKLVILDKDGTLIAFDRLWQRWYQLLLDELTREGLMSEALAEAMPLALGYDSQTGAWDPNGPLTLAATSELVVLVAGLLYTQDDLTWNEAVDRVRGVEQRARAALCVVDLVEPIGDVAKTLQRWSDAGLRLALATTDERQLTEQTLAAAGLEGRFEVMVCGDDGIPLKPAPDMALRICDSLGIAPGDTVVIGDTTGDLAMAKAAGAQAAVGVLSGAGTLADLSQLTDLIVPNLHHITVETCPRTEIDD